MNRAGLLLGLGGLAAAGWLLAQTDLDAAFGLLGTAGFGLVLAALAHAPSMVLNAQAWRLLLPGARRPGLWAMTGIVWVREAVNALLPVARVGGEVAGYRLLRRAGVRAPAAAASLLVDVAVSIVSQLLFALLGLVLLARGGAGLGWESVAGGLLVGAAAAGAFIVVQRAGLLERGAAVLGRVAAGRFGAAFEGARRADRAMRRLWQVRAAVFGCLGWQLAGWAAGALEVWVALWALGSPVGVTEALAIEALIQAVASAAFLVPGALGAQEAGFLGLGLLLGLAPEVAAALALTRRLRDLIVFVPALVGWVWVERRPAWHRSASGHA